MLKHKYIYKEKITKFRMLREDMFLLLIQSIYQKIVTISLKLLLQY